MSNLVKTSNDFAPSQRVAPAVNFFDPAQFETMQRVCKMFASSELVPEMYKISSTNPAEKAISNCMIALEIAQRIGASPLMIMQNMVPIYGRPSWSSKFLIATVNTCGRFEPLQFHWDESEEIGEVEYTDYEKQNGRKFAIQKKFDGRGKKNLTCYAYTRKKGSDEVLKGSPVSIRLAIEEGWYTKNGSKWQTMARQMLMYRAASFWTSTYAPELSMGMHTAEESQDIYTEFEEVKDTAQSVAEEIAANAGTAELTMDEAEATEEAAQATTEAANRTDAGQTQPQQPDF